MHMSEGLQPGYEEVKKGDPTTAISERVRAIHPAYTVIDRSRYDIDTTVKGSEPILQFFTESGKGPRDPLMMVIFKPNEAFVINYYNSPAPENPPPIHYRNSSIHGPGEGWKLRTINLALEAARIQMQGIDPQSEEFLNQIVGYYPELDYFYTMGEIMRVREGYVGEATSFKDRVAREFQGSLKTNAWNFLSDDPEHAKEVAIRRIQKNPEYVYVDGRVASVDDIVGQIRQGTSEGERAVVREINTIDVQQRLLKNNNLL